MSKYKKKILLIIIFYINSIILTALYQEHIAGMNQYIGYFKFEVDFTHHVILFISIITLSLLTPTNLSKPSSFFAILYSLFIVFSYVTLYKIRGPIELQTYSIICIFLFFPILIVNFCTKYTAPINIRFPYIISNRTAVYILLIFSFLGVTYALINAPATSGFDMSSSYERRAESREIFPVKSLPAYLNANIINAYAPFLSFLAGTQINLLLFILSLSFPIIYFYVIGTKAPIIFVLFSFLVGLAIQCKKIQKIPFLIYTCVSFLLTSSLIEFHFLKYSYIGDYIIRRAFTVPAFLISAYSEFMLTTPDWSLITGYNSIKPISFFIGEDYLGFKHLNANTNAFIHQLSSQGIFSYLTISIFVALIFSALDILYKTRKDNRTLFVGLIFSFILLEQAATTALISSGIAILILIVTISSPPKLKITKIIKPKTK